MSRICGTCHYFKVPASWEGLHWNNTQTQVGLCEIPTPRIPKVIDYKRAMSVGSQWIDCPCWTERVEKG